MGMKVNEFGEKIRDEQEESEQDKICFYENLSDMEKDDEGEDFETLGLED